MLRWQALSFNMPDGWKAVRCGAERVGHCGRFAHDQGYATASVSGLNMGRVGPSNAGACFVNNVVSSQGGCLLKAAV